MGFVSCTNEFIKFNKNIYITIDHAFLRSKYTNNIITIL